MIESIFSISPSDVLLALVATVLIELGVLYLLGEKRKRVLLASVVINVATNVPLNLFSNPFIPVVKNGAFGTGFLGAPTYPKTCAPAGPISYTRENPVLI